MKRLAFFLLLLPFLLGPPAERCLGICIQPPPPIPDPANPPRPPEPPPTPTKTADDPASPGEQPPDETPPQDEPPDDGATPTDEPAPPGPPPKDDPAPPKDQPPIGPRTPGTPGQSGGSPGSGVGRGRRPRPRGTFGFAGSWNAWWNLHREDLLGLRHALEGREARTEGGRDPMPGYRKEVRAALRPIAEKESDERLRATALVALGRSGSEYDALLLVKIVRSQQVPTAIRQAAAIGLSGLPRIDDVAIRDEVRRLYGDLLAQKVHLPTECRRLAVLALSLRAPDDPALVRTLGERCVRRIDSATEAAALLFACGLARDPILGPHLSEVVRSGELGGAHLHDIARAYATLGLALCGDEQDFLMLARALTSKETPIHTRRGAAVALGRALRYSRVGGEARQKVVRSLIRAFEQDPDLLVKGYAAVGLGGAAEPEGVDRLVKALAKKRGGVIWPYCALALGLAARDRDTKDSRRIGRLLVAYLGKARGSDQSAAACLAVGLSRAPEGRDLLLQFVKAERGNQEFRGAACEGLGLLGATDPESLAALEKALFDESPDVAFGAALGLGFIGERRTGPLLVRRLTESKSEMFHAHLTIAMAHLGSTAAIQPLLEVLKDPSQKDSRRAAAATTLGLLVDPRKRDPLFEVDATVNPYGLTVAVRELVRVF